MSAKEKIMVDGVQKSILAGYKASLSGEALTNFNKLPEASQIAIAMTNIKDAKPTDLGKLASLKNPFNSQTPATNTDNTSLWAYKQLSNTNDTGLKIEKTSAPETEDNDEEAPKTTKHVVQVGERIQDLVKKELEAQRKTDIDVNSDEFKKAKEEFINNNKDSFGKDNKFMLAGKTVTLDGEVKFDKEKSAAEVDKDYKKYVEKNQAKPKPKADATPKADAKPKTDAKPKADATPKADAKPKAEAKADAKPNHWVNMSADEAKAFAKKHDITIKKGGVFKKDTNTGEVYQAYTNEANRNRIFDVYDKSGKPTRAIVYQKDGPTTSYSDYMGHGNWGKKVATDKDGTSKTFTENYGNNKYRKEVDKDKNGKVTEIDTYDKSGNETKTVQKNGKGEVTEICEMTYDKNGHQTKVVETDKEDNTVKTFTGDDGNGNWAKEVLLYENDGTTVTFTNADKNGDFHQRTINKNGKTKTEHGKWRDTSVHSIKDI